MPPARGLAPHSGYRRARGSARNRSHQRYMPRFATGDDLARPQRLRCTGGNVAIMWTWERLKRALTSWTLWFVIAWLFASFALYRAVDRGFDTAVFGDLASKVK